MTSISNIKEHMQVFASDGVLIGVVDHVEGNNRIKLTKTDSVDGQHHFIDAKIVDHVDAHVHLSKEAEEVMSAWDTENDDELELDDEDIADVEQSPAQKDAEWTERRR